MQLDDTLLIVSAGFQKKFVWDQQTKLVMGQISRGSQYIRMWSGSQAFIEVNGSSVFAYSSVDKILSTSPIDLAARR